MDKNGIKNVVLEIMEQKFGVPSDSTKLTDSFSSDLYVEGADFEDLIIACNKTFYIKIKDADKLTTLKKLVNYIKENQ